MPEDSSMPVNRPDERHHVTVIVADAHVSAGGTGESAFFDMLAALEGYPVDVIFLGDVFDLWIALPRYEGPMQHAFLAWCCRNRNRRMVGFVEGNHEFFVHQSHGSCFSWSTEDAMTDAQRGWYLVHGDQINRRDRQYLRFRKATKNALAKWCVRCLPWGPRWVSLLNARLKRTNPDFRVHFPQSAVTEFAQHAFASGHRRVFVGHFHRPFHIADGDQGLWIVPAWLDGQRVSWIDHHTQAVSSGPWKDLHQINWQATTPASTAC